MHIRTFAALAALCGILAVAPASPSDAQPSMPGAPYLQALRVADLFLVAWAERDADAGLALMSSAALTRNPSGRVDLKSGLRQYMTGLSNPHHQAFEISPGSQVGSDRFAFPVRLFEFYLGDPGGIAFSDTLELVRQGDEWRVDRLPRNYNPDD